MNQAQLAATTVTLALTGTGGATIGTDTGTMTASGATLAGNVLTFAAGSTSAIVTVPVTFDSTTETGEGISMALSAPTGVSGIIASSTAATVALQDVSTPTFTLTSNTVAGTPTQEGGSILFTITPSSIVDKTTVLTVNLAGAVVGAITTQASASDFSAAQTVTFLAGDKAARTTSINVTSDSSTEGIEGYKASLLDSAFAEKSSVTGTITDPTATYVLTGPTSVNEGSSATFTVTSSLAAPAGGVTIPYTLTGNATLTTDYTGSAAATGNITIAAGATTGTLILSAVADNTTEATAENVIVTLGTPSSGNVTTGTVTTTIADTSQGLAAGTVALSSSATAVDEGSAVTYTVTLGTAAPAGGLLIPYTLSGTSTRGTDYTGPSATTGNITVAAGATTGTLVATTVADTTTEGSETLIVTLGTMPSGYTLVSGQGVATTTINDTSLTVSGQTFTLTTGTDSGTAFTGTAGNDTFVGTAATTSPTYTASDVLDGAGGVDILNLTIDTLGATLVPAIIATSIETVNVRNVSGNIQTIDTANFTGATSFNANLGSTNAILTFSNVSSGVDVGVVGNGSVVTGPNTFAYKASATSMNLNVSGGTNPTNSAVVITGTGLTSTVINSTGAVNGLTSVATATTNKTLTINATTGFYAGAINTGAETAYVITGSAATGLPLSALATAGNALDPAVQIGAVVATAKTIDASAMTAGGVGVTLVAAVTSFKGGDGTDEVIPCAVTI